MKPEIIYEDDAVLAVNKPPGLVVHSDGKIDEQTLVDFIVGIHPEMEKIGEPLKLSSGKTIHRGGVVHRLDKETSGVIVFAKNQETFLFLKKQFQERDVKKEYRAIVHGALKEKKGVIDAPIGRSARDFRARAVGVSARGVRRPARTEYTVRAEAPPFSYLSVFPRTGRTHQIRVHLKSIGHPVVCDRLYAPRRACPGEIGRLALHAWSIELKTPHGLFLHLEAPLPDDFEKILGALNIKP